MLSSVHIRIDARDLPGRSFAEHRDVHVAVQRGSEPWEPVPGDASSATWSFEVTDRPGGPFVHGKAGDKFLYLTWGDLAHGQWHMFRRAKLHFTDVPPEVLATGSIVARLGLTDGRGGPLCARVRPPVVEWTAG